MKQLNRAMLRGMKQLTALDRELDDTQFERSIALEPVAGSPGAFTVDLAEEWSSLIGIHGGYMAAITVRGAETVAVDRTVRTTSTTFLRAGEPGPARLEVRELRRSRSLSTVTADLVQGPSVLMSTRTTLTTDREGVEWATLDPIPLPSPDRCVPVEPPPGNHHLARVDALLDPTTVPFTNGERALIRGYFRPWGTRSIDPAWLTMAADWFPPPAFIRVAPPTGGISIDLVSHLHQPHVELADGEWLVGSFGIDTSTGGLALEHGRITREDGTLVSESFHSRWTAER